MGDGGTSEPDFHVSLNFAGVMKAPVVLVCQNNQWAISTPLAKQTVSETIAQKGLAFGMPSLQVDGNDALAMYKATREALDRAYRGEGPTFIEAVTYRLMMHTTADDPTKYRSEEQVKEWEKRDPLIRFRVYLRGKKLWDDDKEAALLEQVKHEIDGGVREYETREVARPETAFDHVYGTRHAHLEEQRAEFMASLQRSTPHG
jgi:pyruvate dehydrogenase E1 component alpha subunit